MNKKLSRNNNSEDDEDDYFLNNKLGYSVKSLQINHFRVHLDEKVMDASYYSRVFEMMLDAGEHDSITFFISSVGGLMEGLNVLMEGVRLTDAYTTAVLVGSAHSSASIFALNCDEVVVTDSADMLCHEVSYGTGGKGSDVYSDVMHTKRMSEKILTETYTGFLNEKELSSLLAGSQIYLVADEIREKLQHRAEYLEAKDKAEKEPKPTPKKPTAKKKAPSQK